MSLWLLPPWIHGCPEGMGLPPLVNWPWDTHAGQGQEVTSPGHRQRLPALEWLFLSGVQPCLGTGVLSCPTLSVAVGAHTSIGLLKSDRILSV